MLGRAAIPFVLSHLWDKTKQLLYDSRSSSCLWSTRQRLRSGRAGVRPVHAGGVQVGVGLVGARVIHVDVRVGTNLRRVSPPDWEEGKESQNWKRLFSFVCFEALA